MMEWMRMTEIFVLLVFGLLLFLIFLYSLSQLQLLVNYFLKGQAGIGNPLDLPIPLPHVTIQLPLYNEKEVVERLLKNMAEMDYPREKLEIQVLDDSTDESADLTKKLVTQLQDTGLDIKFLSRSHREDFKAGALRDGLKTAKGDFIAIFDSDFLPKSDWLKLTLPYFKDEQIGVVQTRWGHLNRNYSLLTRVQAFALDFHFFIEQNGRNFSEYFINFNGTAGIWRKDCILQAGGWEGDTLTEDLDLSYRAQLKNWKFKYLGEVETPAELPITIEAARSQQFRWNKGAAENFQKNYRKVMADKNLPIGTKIHCFFHLLNSSLFLLVLGLALLSLPVLFLSGRPEYDIFFNLILICGVSPLIFLISYWVTYSKVHGSSLKTFLHFIGLFFSFFSIAMGFSLHNSRAVLQGHFGKKSEFIRTPKFNISGPATIYKKPLSSVEKKSGFSLQLFLEFMLFLYSGSAVAAAFWLQNYKLILLHLMLLFGFGYIVFNSLQNYRLKENSPIIKTSKKPLC